MFASKRVLLILLVLLGAAALGTWYAVQVSRLNGAALRVSGNIEATEVNIAFKIPGRVEKRLVDEGDVVRRGQTIAQLDTADLEADVAVRRAELRAAKAALAELEAGSRVDEINAARAGMEKARATLAELEAGSRPQEIDTAMAERDAAKVEKDRLYTEFQRAERLHRNGTITTEQYDQATAAYRVANERYLQASKRYDLAKEGPRQEQIDHARAAFMQAEAQYRLVEAGPREEVIEQGRAKVEQAKAAVQSAETRLGYATVVSPLTGVVLSKNIEPGEYVSPGTPVVTVADIENVWLRAYIDERDIGKKLVRWGTEAKITTDAYPGKVYQGHVSFISSEEEFTPKSVQTERERVKLVYRIKIDVKNPDRELKPGMPADARLLPEEEK
jgi:HlyD family secretion protein